jgi:hypothetical protein
MTRVDDAFSTFTSHELERLRVYKGAVAAHVYSDWDGSAEATDTDTLAWLPQAANPPGYPFTEAELHRLTACRDAIGAGYYSEDVRSSSPRGRSG